MKPTSLLRIATAGAAAWLLTLSAQAATFTLLHEFTGADGAQPEAGLAQDGNGNLYGTTIVGGTANFGTLFKYDGVQLVTLHMFASGADGGWPHGGLLADSEGNLYGTTSAGGGGYGTVFRWDREQAQHLQIIKNFIDRAADGIQPAGGLARDADGTVYGNTVFGGDMSCGSVGCGTLFKISPTGRFTQLHRFGTADHDASTSPNPTLLRRGDHLWGGGVYAPFSLKTDGSGFAVLPPTNSDFNFIGGLTADANGNLWGVAFNGGAYKMGSIYKIDASGHYVVVHDFAGSDGAYPSGMPIIDAHGILYGTTNGYGALQEGSGAGGWGTVWQYDTQSNVLTTLHQFSGSDGKNPQAGVVRDAHGDLYGVTTYGGSADMGVLFRVAP